MVACIVVSAPDVVLRTYDGADGESATDTDLGRLAVKPFITMAGHRGFPSRAACGRVAR
jgi:hypothetical protein